MLWVVSNIVNSRQVAQWARTPNGAVCRVDFLSYFPGSVEPTAVSVLAALDATKVPNRLHISLLEELPEHTS